MIRFAFLPLPVSRLPASRAGLAAAIVMGAFLIGSGAASAFSPSTVALSAPSGVVSINRLMPDAMMVPRPGASTAQRRTVRVAPTTRRVVTPSGAARPSAQQNQRAVQRQRLAALGSQPTQRRMDPAFLPQDVAYTGKQKPGTIVIDTEAKFLYHVGKNGQARRYGVGVGRPGFEWSGRHRVSMKREWPGWTPPAAMRKRQPELPAFMPGGPENPLGARALYLGSTLYRIHGSNAPWTIGQAVSSGCIRMRNEDVIELYERVKVGTPVVVLR